ncbi:MAG: ribonuclease III [Ignavibacterium sp.]|nr:ribonuclease III [Ignavibacterium sp.]MCX7611282.1 ribonuclease III [Ignavibacterium sp.]MDW8375634.1 ribonuclease III [Ignavibacteriales bacterium]
MRELFSRIKKFLGWGKSNQKNISKYHLTNEQITELEKRLGFPFIDKSHYIQALIHRSYLEKTDIYDYSNERLEFLGDAVLNLVVADYLFHKFPDEDEGFLTKVRSKLVNRQTLSQCAEKLNLNEFLFLNRNLNEKSDRGIKTILSDAFEAIIGAIYLDLGLDTCKKFLHNVLILPFINSGEHLIDQNYKSQLLEYAQSEKLELPVYKIINEEGPQHDRTFTIQVKLGENLIGVGTGKNKKEAEQEAAKNLINQIKK